MAKRKVVAPKEEVSREMVDNDHVLITYSDGTTESRVI